MKRHQPSGRNNKGALTKGARVLLTATADAAGTQVAEARQRLSAALERGQEIYGHMREQARETAEAADAAVHQHPYRAIALGLGVGALIGFLATRRCTN